MLRVIFFQSKVVINSDGKDVGKLDHSYTANKNVKPNSHSEKLFSVF
jgi:hypothetical protein